MSSNRSSPACLAKLTKEVPPRIIIEYANPNHYEKLIFPTERINDTTPPVITNVTATNITDNLAAITWNTDEVADSLVNYSTASGRYTESEESQLFVVNHTIGLSGLSSGTTYYLHTAQ